MFFSSRLTLAAAYSTHLRTQITLREVVPNVG